MYIDCLRGSQTADDHVHLGYNTSWSNFAIIDDNRLNHIRLAPL